MRREITKFHRLKVLRGSHFKLSDCAFSFVDLPKEVNEADFVQQRPRSYLVCPVGLFRYDPPPASNGGNRRASWFFVEPLLTAEDATSTSGI
jgi:hypothetical protein